MSISEQCLIIILRIVHIYRMSLKFTNGTEALNHGFSIRTLSDLGARDSPPSQDSLWRFIDLVWLLCKEPMTVLQVISVV